MAEKIYLVFYITTRTLGFTSETLAPNVDTVITNIGENFGKTILIGYYLGGELIGTNHVKRENLKGGVSWYRAKPRP